jgi:hypothetical protein
MPAAASAFSSFLPVSSQYQDIHQLFFPRDSNVLSASSHPNAAGDSSWQFFTSDSPAHRQVTLQYYAPRDWVDKAPLRLQAGTDAAAATLAVISHQTGSTGSLFIFLYFGAQLLAVFLAYKVTMALAIRIFMIGIFRDSKCPPRDHLPGEPPPHDHPANDTSIAPGGPPHSPQEEHPDEDLPSWLSAIRSEEKQSKEQELILCNRLIHEKLYAQLWSPLLPIEKFVLFDLAKDGFSNYRTASILYQLRKKKLLVFCNGRLDLVSDSFREYVLDQSTDKSVISSLKKSRQNGTWQAFKLPLTILFTAFGLFIFFTQGALYQKLGGLFTSLISMGAQISSFFDRTGRQPAPEPEEEK